MKTKILDFFKHLKLNYRLWRQGHTTNCRLTAIEVVRQRKVFERKHPDFCRICDGWGVIERGQMGEALYMLCDCVCLHGGHCPTCAHELAEGEENCTHCAWGYYSGPPGVHPAIPILCFCDGDEIKYLDLG